LEKWSKKNYTEFFELFDDLVESEITKLESNSHIYVRTDKNECKYKNVKDFSEGLAPVKIKSSWGYIDKKGKLVIDNIFQNAFRFQDGLAKIKINGKYGFINTSGKIIINAEFDEVLRMDDRKTILACKNNFLSKQYNYLNHNFLYIQEN
jgi:hypothetical protein